MITMSDIANNAKVTLLWRAGLGICTLVTTIAGTIILGYVKSADSKLSRIDGDVAQIKWELPVIKSTQQADKVEIQSRISRIESQITTLMENGDGRNKQIQILQIEMALLKQKLQLP